MVGAQTSANRCAAPGFPFPAGPQACRQLRIWEYQVAVAVRARAWEKPDGVAFIAIQSTLRHRVEESEEAIKILLRDRVEFVVVAARAAHGEAQEGGGGGADAIDHVLDVILSGDGADFTVIMWLRLKPEAIFWSMVALGSRSPATWSRMNSSYGMFWLKALMTQSRHAHMSRRESMW